MNKLVFSTVLSLLSLFVIVAPATADTTCQPVYGGGQTCVQVGNVLINKTVKNPQTGAFVDNLGVNDPKFSPDQQVPFQLTVTNTGSSTLSKVTVKDTLPQFVDYVSGLGTFDQASKTLTFEVSDLKANESRTFNLTAKVVSVGALPSDQSVVCVVNQAQATANNQTSADNAQFCIQTQPQPTKGGQQPTETKGGLKVFPPTQQSQMPSTGPEALALLALIPSGIAGMFLRKKTSK
ncbi:DUF11 domain-containing protein [Candidatus Microgenomates bacterium]|nr:DUF11 domain-containing protein [Candidatus Microgenomates bacterium]